MANSDKFGYLKIREVFSAAENIIDILIDKVGTD